MLGRNQLAQCPSQILQPGWFAEHAIDDGGVSFSAIMREPQPVNMMTGVRGDRCLMPSATRRPSTVGMPRSVTTRSKA